MEQLWEKGQVKSFFKIEEIMTCLFGNHLKRRRELLEL